MERNHQVKMAEKRHLEITQQAELEALKASLLKPFQDLPKPVEVTAVEPPTPTAQPE